MLNNNFYQIKSLSGENGSYKTQVKIDPDHAVFHGHFPGQPVLPGVCLIEMVKELLGEIGKRPYQLVNASNIKFLQIADPRTNNLLDFEIEVAAVGDLTKVNVSSFIE